MRPTDLLPTFWTLRISLPCKKCVLEGLEVESQLLFALDDSDDEQHWDLVSQSGC